MTQDTTSVAWPERLTLFFGISAQIVGVLFFSRLTIDIGTRMVYPFIPQFSEGLGLSIRGFGWLLSLRALAGFVGPLFGLLADRYGRRNLMALGLLCQSVGTLGIFFTRQWWVAGPMFIFGLSLTAFIPAQQAYVSDKVPYAKRGRSLAAIEFAWATVGIVMLPVIGWLIDAFGWQAPFLFISLLSLLSALLVWFGLPGTEQQTAQPFSWAGLGAVLSRPNVLASVGVSMLLFVAATCFSTVWGIWLSEDFSLQAAALGLVATVIGVAELSGSGASSLFIDRLGKRRGSQLGLLLTAGAFLLLIVAQSALWLAIVALFLIGLVIEFTIVSLIGLYSEQAPEARAMLFSLVALGAAIGIFLGAPLTTELWTYFGLGAVCGVSALCLGLAVGLIHRFLPEQRG